MKEQNNRRNSASGSRTRKTTSKGKNGNSGRPKFSRDRKSSERREDSRENGGFRGSRNGGGGRRNGGNSRGRSSRGGGGKRKGTYIPVEKFIHEGRPLQEVKYESQFKFNEMPIHPTLLKNILDLGFTSPTGVQDKTFTPISEVRDVLAIANTGTGKTAAYLIPIINAILLGEDKFQTLIMVPTRELAEQVEDELKKLSKGLKLFGASFIGGKSISNDLRKLRRSFDFIIGTPGRLIDLSRRKAIRFEDFSVLILDEFDRMLDMGFSKDVNYITDQMASREQTLLFSATLDKTQKEIISSILNNPVEVKISSGNSTAEHIDQDVVYYNRKDKYEVLLAMLEKEDFEKVMVFTETKRGVGELAEKLKRSRIKVDEIHGDKTQSYRKYALKDFKDGKINVLVGTDVAARGLDISDVTHVINYQVPQDYETYIHRIGRTGRAGKKGTALTFVEKKNN